VNTKPSRRSAGQEAASVPANPSAQASAGPASDEFTAAVLRFLRFSPNATNSPNGMIRLAPLAEQLGVDPFEVQLAVERLADRRLVNLPFIEPDRAGGAELTEKGLRWLIRHEGGKPKDVPVAYQQATAPVRTADEAARLPRAEVYGTRN
jgi:hypothetical protein